MGNKLTFYIVRHGKTVLNTLEQVQGWCDSPLTDEGIEAAEYLGKGLKHILFRSVYCSDLKRTEQTANVILNTKQQSVSLTEIFGFREACFGSYERDSNYKLWADVATHLQYKKPEDLTEAIHNCDITYKDVLDTIKKMDKLGTAENFEQIKTRTIDALTKIAEQEAKDGQADILIVSHGMAIIVMMLGLGAGKLANKRLDNASVSKVVYQDGTFTVESVGDMQYVEAGKLVV